LVSAFLKAELKVFNSFQGYVRVGNSDALPVKSPELVSVLIDASRNLKSIFLS
jgi:hypothetical protein